MITRASKGNGILGTANTRFGNTDNTCRHLPGHSHRPVVIDRKGNEIALVHSDEICADRERDIELFLVVDLDKNVEPDRQRELMHPSDLVARQRCGDQQHTVGTHDSCVTNVTKVDREVLSDHRKSARLSRSTKVDDRTSEMGLVGENGHRRRTAGFINTSQFGSVESGIQVPLRRRPTLDLGDDGQMPISGRRQSFAETPRRRTRLGPANQVGEMTGVGRRTGAMMRDDLVEIRRQNRLAALAADGLHEDQLGTTTEERRKRRTPVLEPL